LKFGNRDLLEDYGRITTEEVIAARDARNSIMPQTVLETRPQIQAEMMFHFIYESLGQIPTKKISTRLKEINDDGPTILKYVLNDTFIGTEVSTYTIKERFYDLNLKQF